MRHAGCEGRESGVHCSQYTGGVGECVLNNLVIQRLLHRLAGMQPAVRILSNTYALRTERKKTFQNDRTVRPHGMARDRIALRTPAPLRARVLDSSVSLLLSPTDRLERTYAVRVDVRDHLQDGLEDGHGKVTLITGRPGGQGRGPL